MSSQMIFVSLIMAFPQLIITMWEKKNQRTTKIKKEDYVAQGAPFCMVKTYIEKSIVIQEEKKKLQLFKKSLMCEVVMLYQS